MKAARGSVIRSVDQPDRSLRFYLFHGPDEAGSRALANRLLVGLGAEKVPVSGAAIKADPALLAVEAGAISMFGGPRAIWVEPAGDDIADGARALFESAAVESPVIALAGALRKSSTLLKLAEAESAALSHASYAPEGRDADRMVIDMGQSEGLRIEAGLAGRIAAAAGGNRAIVASELAKFALYLDAAPDRPKDLTHDTLDLIGADSSEGDMMRLGDLALSGQVQALFEEFERSGLASSEAIPVVRALQRRLLQLAPLRSRVERGESSNAVMASMGKALFWKDEPLMQRLLASWSSERLAHIMERSAILEKGLILSDEPQIAALEEELTAIARASLRRR